jgi:hypothetical protein
LIQTPGGSSRAVVSFGLSKPKNYRVGRTENSREALFRARQRLRTNGGKHHKKSPPERALPTSYSPSRRAARHLPFNANCIGQAGA